jgi:hypothetical protein
MLILGAAPVLQDAESEWLIPWQCSRAAISFRAHQRCRIRGGILCSSGVDIGGLPMASTGLARGPGVARSGTRDGAGVYVVKAQTRCDRPTRPYGALARCVRRPSTGLEIGAEQVTARGHL